MLIRLSQESGQDTSSVVAKLLVRIAQTGDDGEEEEKEIAKDVAAVAVEGQSIDSIMTQYSDEFNNAILVSSQRRHSQSQQTLAQ